MTLRSYDELDTVVLLRDIPEVGLRVGDLGTLVQIYSLDSFDVEFITASGRIQALITLNDSDVRPVRDDDLLAVRSPTPTGGLT